jgi:hypothetical protein
MKYVSEIEESIDKAPSPSPLPTGQAGSPSRGEGCNISLSLDGDSPNFCSPPLRGGDEGEGEIRGFVNGPISSIWVLFPSDL